MFLRQAVTQTIRWGGRPPRRSICRGDVPRLTPRGSFQSFLEEHTDRCDEWNEDDLRVARVLNDALSAAIVTEGRLGTLVRELNHRVRNILAL